MQYFSTGMSWRLVDSEWNTLYWGSKEEVKKEMNRIASTVVWC